MSKTKWVSASDAGRAAYCPKYLQHKHEKTAISKMAEAAREKGEAEHQLFNHQAKQRDKRCYIASYVYGIDDPRTNALRQFRDDYLKKNIFGRLLVKIYYFVSPTLVRLCQHCKPIDLRAKAMTDRVLNLVQKRYK